MFEFLQKLFGPKEHGHSKIDSLMDIQKIDTLISQLSDPKDRIDPSTVQETRRGLAPFGMNINALYEAETYGGEKRDIFRQGYPSEEEQSGMTDKENQSRMFLNLLEELKMNPGFADTLTAETRPDVKAEFDYSAKPLRYLKHLFTK